MTKQRKTLIDCFCFQVFTTLAGCDWPWVGDGQIGSNCNLNDDDDDDDDDDGDDDGDDDDDVIEVVDQITILM